MMQLEFDYTWKRACPGSFQSSGNTADPITPDTFPFSVPFPIVGRFPPSIRSIPLPRPSLRNALDIPRGYSLNLICRRYASRTKGFLGRGWRLRSNIISVVVVDIDRSRMQGGAHRRMMIIGKRSRRQGGPHTTAFRLLSTIDQKREREREKELIFVAFRREARTEARTDPRESSRLSRGRYVNTVLRMRHDTACRHARTHACGMHASSATEDASNSK